ncbi:GNAT family N-acetyltransferase [Bosea lathyri]|uniref:Acetyltransferase (GNAT) domain-containing protein n=1 Tax=Bosea lathyri TaxID=1036778 RepID=A0A1H6B0Q1_9HYPH|nr:GNAT family N-acetyltransferase [Bosea lathyri]SEG54369.1 Acetyltransferase (GNAT) domain-containing protein [Bosea lathyri]
MKIVEAPAIRDVEDKSAFLALMLASWGSHSMMLGLHVYDCAELDLLGVFSADGEAMAYASWTMRGDVGLLCALHSVAPGQGAAIQLLEAVKAAAKARGAVKLRAMLTNDNMPGLAFYQKFGFRFSGLYLEAIDSFRSVIPTIIRTGYMGIPVRDALELEIDL